MSNYPESVSFDVRFTCDPADMPWVLDGIYAMSRVPGHDVEVDILRPDTLPYGNVTDLLGD